MKQGKASRGAEFEAAPVKVFAGDLGDLRQPRQAQGKPKASPRQAQGKPKRNKSFSGSPGPQWECLPWVCGSTQQGGVRSQRSGAPYTGRGKNIESDSHRRESR